MQFSKNTALIMRLHKLHLLGFRSYVESELTIDSTKRTLFYGNNGVGKTNIIEALSYLSAGRSCLRLSPDTAVRWGEMFFRLTAEIETDRGEPKTAEYVFQTSPRRQSACFINDLRTPLVSFIGTLPTIIFLPEHLDLFSGAPQGRRQFIDALLAQLFPSFPAERLEYDRVLKQRNAALKMIARNEAPMEDLTLWDETLARAALPISTKRREILSALSKELPAWVEHFGEVWQCIALDVQSRAGESEAEFLQNLRDARKRDIILETTSVGPHRDDWVLTVESRPLATFASRGQQRTALLSLLVASSSLFTEYRNERPLILLDDVFSELDLHHQEALTTSLSDAQIIMTSTHDTVPHSSLIQRRVEEGIIEDALVYSP